jgi:hypothetical protein
MAITPTTWSTTVGGGTLTNGNLTVAIAGGPYAVSEYAASTGKYYFELTFAPGEALGEIIIGVSDSAGTAASIHGVDPVGGRCYEGETDTWYGTAPGFTPISLASGCTVGVCIDIDAETIGIVTTGGDQGIVMTGFAGVSAPMRVAFLDDPYQYTAPVTTTANFGATAFAFTPPGGYNSGFGAGGASSNGAIAYAPMGVVAAYSGARVLVSAPACVVAATSTTRSNLALSAPVATISALGGANSALTAPTPTLSSFAGATSELTAPGPSLSATAYNSFGERAAILTAPSPTLSAYTGASADFAAPVATLSATATCAISGSADISAPASLIEAAGTVSDAAQSSLSAPSPNLIGYSGAVCSVTLTGGPTITATGTAGGVGGAQITAPLFELTSSGTAQAYGSANLIAPAAQMGSSSVAYLVAPSATLTAIGHAVVTATYEAYAVNLKHQPKPGKEPVDEVTRYTNFPFTHIVRYQNSYFGANSTGLYLLEGTTDAGTPIPWAFKTALMDFKSPFQKTVASAYFGGRLGAADTITLYAGEGAGTAYSYTTPRGALAQNHRQAFGKGIKQHRYYAIGANGADVLELDDIDLDVHNLTRRI